jgi:hypothetical protein
MRYKHGVRGFGLDEETALLLQRGSTPSGSSGSMSGFWTWALAGAGALVVAGWYFTRPTPVRRNRRRRSSRRSSRRRQTSRRGRRPKPNRTGRFVAYHGTVREMDRPAQFRDPRSMDFGPGFYLATEAADARSYGPWVYRTEIDLRNPVVLSRAQYDSALVARLKRALRMTDDDLRFHSNPLVGIFDMAKELYSMGAVRPRALISVLQKWGYDGIYVESGAIEDHHKMQTAGDYVVIWEPEQLLTWERVSGQS